MFSRSGNPPKSFEPKPLWGSCVLAVIFAFVASALAPISLAQSEEDTTPGLPLWLLYWVSKEQSDHNLSANCQGSERHPERLFLQQIGPDRAIIKWRNTDDSLHGADHICYGTDKNVLPLSSKTYSITTALDHQEVALSGLTLHWQHRWTVAFRQLEGTRTLSHRLTESTAMLERHLLEKTNLPSTMVPTKVSNLVYLDRPETNADAPKGDHLAMIQSWMNQPIHQGY